MSVLSTQNATVHSTRRFMQNYVVKYQFSEAIIGLVIKNGFLIQIVVIAIIFATLCRRSVNLVKNWKEQNDEEVLLSPSPVPPTNTEESTENQSG